MPSKYKRDENTIVLEVKLVNGDAVVVDESGNKVTEAKVVVTTKGKATLVIDNVSSSQNKPITGSTKPF